MKHSKFPWTLKRIRNSNVTFIAGQRAPEMAYEVEILGDDYTGYGDDQGRADDVSFVFVASVMHEKLVEEIRRDIEELRQIKLSAADDIRLRLQALIREVETLESDSAVTFVE